MKKTIYFIFFSLLAISCNKEIENFKPTKKLENILEDKKFKTIFWEFRLKNPFLYGDIEKSESFKKFVAESKNEQLVSLTECENPKIRCFAFEALVEKDYSEIRKILNRHINDNERIEELRGCLKFNQEVKFYMLSQLEPFSKSKYRFDKIEYEKTRMKLLNNE